MTQRMIGPFEVGDRIGVGGMGIVYRATYTKNGAQVALKILSPDLSETESLQLRFERDLVRQDLFLDRPAGENIL